jgi:anti-sigma regulatory factor (Ser/Thr protein kinase)
MRDDAHLELTLPARPESVSVARQAVSGLADAFAWNAEFIADLKIAVSEACSNVVAHAYPDEGDAGPLLLRVWVDDVTLVVSVADEGRGITPTLSKGAGLGLGLPLMAALSDEVRVKSGADGATQVTMTFTLPDGETPTSVP